MALDRATPGLEHAYHELPSNVTREFVPLTSSDGVDTFGVLHQRANHRSRTAILVMHPRGEFTRHYAAALLATRGYAVLCHTTRYVNNDTDAVHERMLLDVAVAMRWLRSEGYDNLLLLGNSGGGSLTSLYQWQATLPPGARLKESPGGYRIPLAHEDMPAAVGMIHVAAHAGEGNFMRKVIDPAVIDDADPCATDADLDMYNYANGRRPFPEPSHYDPEWLTRYRLAQDERCRRLDLIARAYLDERFAVPDSVQELDAKRRYAFERRRRTMRYMVIYRTLADPAYLDPTIDPSERPLGSVFAAGDTIVGNYGMGGLGRVLTPRAWLSTWSPFSTNADMVASLKHIKCPCLFVGATGDSEIRPGEFASIVNACPSEDKTAMTVAASHYLLPLHRDAPDPRETLGELLQAWLAPRFRTGGGSV